MTVGREVEGSWFKLPVADQKGWILLPPLCIYNRVQHPPHDPERGKEAVEEKNSLYFKTLFSNTVTP